MRRRNKVRTRARDLPILLRRRSRSGIGALANYTPSDTPANYVWDARGDFYHSQVAGASPEDHVTLTGPSVVRDSDGLLKWSAHNICDYSDLSGAVVGVVGAGGALPTGWSAGSGIDEVEILEISTYEGLPSIRLKITADAAGGTKYPDIQNVIGSTVAADYTFDCKVKVVSSTNMAVKNMLLYAGSAIATYSMLGSGDWETVSIEGAAAAGAAKIFPFNGTVNSPDLGVIDFWIAAPRVYRSDLGGMQNNPDTGDSYVPTTGAAAYMRAVNYAVSGAREGVLNEPARTNLVTYSIPDAAPPTNWTSPVGTGTVTQATLTNGLPGLRFQATSERPMVQQSVTFVASTEYTLSVILEPGGTSSGSIIQVTGLSDATGTLSATAASVDANGVVSITFTTGADVSGSIRYGLGTASNDTGDETLGGIQLEVGASYTSRIPTTTGSVVRAASVVSVAKAHAGTDAELVEGTWIIGVSGLGGTGKALASSVGGENVFELAATAVNTYSGSNFLGNSNGTVIGGEHKLALAFEDGVGRSLAYDSVATTDGNDYLDTNPPAQFYVLQDQGGSGFPGGILQFLIFVPKRETDAVIEDITDPATLYGTALEILTPLADISDTVGNGPWVVDYSAAYFGNDLDVSLSLGQSPEGTILDTSAQTITIPDDIISDEVVVVIENSVGIIHDIFSVEIADVANTAPTLADFTAAGVSDVGNYSQNLVDTDATGYLTHTATGFTNTGKLTYSFWIEPTNINSTNDWIHRTGSGGAGRTLYQDDAEIKFAIRDSADVPVLIARTNNAPLAVGVRTHVFIQMDITGASLVASIKIGGTEYYGSGDLTVDNGPAVGTKLFNHATAGQICAQSGSVGDLKLSDFFFSSDLVDYAQFHDGAGGPTKIFGDGSPEIKITGDAADWDAAVNVGSVTLASGATGFLDA